MRVELYGIYMTDNMCAAAGQETATTKNCTGNRNCSLNADCEPITSESIIKTGEFDFKISALLILLYRYFSNINTSLLYRHLSNTDTSLIKRPL